MRRDSSLKLLSKRGIFSELVGNNLSSFKGDGFEFMELRAYESGDDIRRIDWKSTAKMGQPFVKEFIAERELSVVVVVIESGSLHFGLKRLKSELVYEIVELLGLSTLKNSDSFSFVSYEKQITQYQKPSKSISSLKRTLNAIHNTHYLQKKPDVKLLEKELLERIKRKSLVIILGDFVGQFRLTKLAKKHEVVALIIRDRLEENPPQLSGISLIDPNSFVHNDAVSTLGMKAYRDIIAQNDKKLHEDFIKDSIRSTKIYTDEDPYYVLKKFFSKGR